MIVYTRADEADDREQRADHVDPGRLGSRDVGTMSHPAITAPMTIGTFTMNTEPHEKWSSRKPPVTGPSATADTSDRGPQHDRDRALLRDR